MYVVVWEFTPRAGAENAFERLYGPAGAWVALFARAPGWVGSELLRPRDASRRYLTVDRWRSHADYAAFRRAHADAYAAIDAEGEQLMAHERLVGEFDAG